MAKKTSMVRNRICRRRRRLAVVPQHGFIGLQRPVCVSRATKQRQSAVGLRRSVSLPLNGDVVVQMRPRHRVIVNGRRPPWQVT